MLLFFFLKSLYSRGSPDVWKRKCATCQDQERSSVARSERREERFRGLDRKPWQTKSARGGKSRPPSVLNELLRRRLPGLWQFVPKTDQKYFILLAKCRPGVGESRKVKLNCPGKGKKKSRCRTAGEENTPPVTCGWTARREGCSVGLPVDRAALPSRWWGARQALLCVLWAGAVLALEVGGGGGAGRCGRGLGLLLKVCDDDGQVSHRHLQVLGAAAVDVF